jgi:hypothetical protein
MSVTETLEVDLEAFAAAWRDGAFVIDVREPSGRGGVTTWVSSGRPAVTGERGV